MNHTNNTFTLIYKSILFTFLNSDFSQLTNANTEFQRGEIMKNAHNFKILNECSGRLKICEF